MVQVSDPCDVSGPHVSPVEPVQCRVYHKRNHGKTLKPTAEEFQLQQQPVGRET